MARTLRRYEWGGDVSGLLADGPADYILAARHSRGGGCAHALTSPCARTRLEYAVRVAQGAPLRRRPRACSAMYRRATSSAQRATRDARRTPEHRSLPAFGTVRYSVRRPLGSDVVYIDDAIVRTEYPSVPFVPVVPLSTQ